MKSTGKIVSALLVTVGCSQGAFARGDEASPSVPPAIAVPAGHEVGVKFSASGVQIYRCQPSTQAGSDFVWTFVAPEATLSSKDGKVAGRHYAGPTWEANDGSKVVGKLVAKAAAPDAVSIPWLLLSATIEQRGEAFKRIAFVQRVNTSGGGAPGTGCTADTANAEVRVPYTADYYFYAPAQRTADSLSAY